VRRVIFDAEHEDFRASVRSFIASDAVPHTEAWEELGMVDRSFWRSAAGLGFVGFEAPEEYGGAGISDFRFNAILDEEMAYATAVGDNFSLENDIIAPYLIELTNSDQKARWLPAFTAGELVVALALSEPGAGSDLRAISTTAHRDNGGYVIRGSKTFVTSGLQADLVLVAARMPALGSRSQYGIFAVERGCEGFTPGSKLRKIGRRAQDTAELFFDSVWVSAANLIGEEGKGLSYVMRNLPRERVSIAVSAVASAEQALAMTLDYVKGRHAFGRPVGSFQANRFTLADMATKIRIARTYIDQCILALTRNELTGGEAAGAKAWTTDLQFSVLDTCLQLHGGYGYTEDYPIARLWRDSRVQRIYGGTNEIMREIVGRDLGL
jgi:acyl-CoA dehydrogenase